MLRFRAVVQTIPRGSGNLSIGHQESNNYLFSTCASEKRDEKREKRQVKKARCLSSKSWLKNLLIGGDSPSKTPNFSERRK